MKTSKEMQLKILDRMKENVKRDLPLFDGLYRITFGSDFILDAIWENSFVDAEHGIYPERITINGVEIPKPLDVSEINPGGHYYFMPCLSANLCTAINGYDGQKFEYKLLYATKEEAIEASKLLFGIKQ